MSRERTYSRTTRPSGQETPWGPAPSAVHLLTLLSGGWVVILLTRHLWFFGDEWDFIVGPGLHGVMSGLLVPHNEHWSTLPVLAWTAVQATAGLHSYRPYILVLLVCHLVLAHLLWRLMRQCGASPWVSTALVAVFAVLGAGAENLVWAFQVGFVGAVAFGIAALLLTEGRAKPPNRWNRAAAWIALLAALMCSGVGVTLVVVAGLAAFFRRGLRDALLAVSAPGLVYIAWFFAFGHGHTGAPPAQSGDYLRVPEYVLTGLRNSVESVTGVPLVGFPVLLGLAVALFRGWSKGRHEAAIPMALGLGAVIFFILAGISRISFGVDQALAMRYVYIAASLLLVPCAVILSRLASRSRFAHVAILAVVGLVGLHNLLALRTAAADRAALDNRQREIIVAAARLVAQGRVIAPDNAQPLPTVDPGLHLGELRRLIAEGQLRPGDPPTPSHVPALDADAQLGVVLTPGRLPAQLGNAVAVRAASGITAIVDQCASVGSPGQQARFRLIFGDDAAVQIVPTGAGAITTYLSTSDRPDELSLPAIHDVKANRPVLLRVAVPGTVALVVVPAGVTTICGLRG